jgi:hypothetical protein
LLAACAAADQTIDTVFDPCAPLALVIEGEASDAERLSLEAAVALWNDVAGTRLTTSANLEPPAIERVVVRFESAAPVFFGIYLDEVGEIVINHAFTNDRARAVTIAHEVGHAFGLEHVDAGDASSLMNPGNLELGPTPGDQTELAVLWGACLESPAERVSSAGRAVLVRGR